MSTAPVSSIQFGDPDPIIQQKLTVYLRDPDAHNVIIRTLYPRLVQRSYGREKRFFCPPPIVYIGGPGWKRCADEISKSQENNNSPLSHRGSILNENLRWYCELGLNDHQTHLSSNIEFALVNASYYNELLGSGLHISNADKRKYFRMTLSIEAFRGPTTLNPLRHLGVFETTPIHVISKPPKKQSSATVDTGYVRLKSGMKVAVCQRTRCQTFATKYMYVQGDTIVGNQGKWSCFYIYLVALEDVDHEEDSFVSEDGFIKYGDVVRLVDCLTGVCTPNLTIRKIDDGNVILDPNSMEFVAQLHRVAFQINGVAYWSLSGTQIVQREVHAHTLTHHEALDSIAWITVEADFCELKFYEALGLTKDPVTPIPIVTTVDMGGTSENNSYIEMRGSGLGGDLNVWFGLLTAHVEAANDGFMRVKVPAPRSVLQLANSHPRIVKYFYDEENSISKVAVPITLVRGDGVVYPTDVSFHYNCTDVGGIGDVAMKDIFEKQLTEFDKTAPNQDLRRASTEEDRGIFNVMTDEDDDNFPPSFS